MSIKDLGLHQMEDNIRDLCNPLTLLQDVVTHLTNVVNAYVQITKFAFP